MVVIKGWMDGWMDGDYYGLSLDEDRISSPLFAVVVF